MDRKDFSIVIPLYDYKTVLLVGQYRIPCEYYSWEFPMGRAEEKDPEANARRELKEETGIHANKWTYLGSYFVVPGCSAQRCNIYVAQDLSEGETKPDDTEFLEKKKFLINEVENMIKDGIIKDGPTIVSFQYLARFLKNI